MLRLLHKPDDLFFQLSQARQLKDGTLMSCLFVEIIIINSAIMMFFQDMKSEAVLWTVSASLMVGVTYLHGRLSASSGLTERNVRTFLLGHLIVTAMTGLLWGGMAIHFFDQSSVFRVFISTLVIFSIALGGMLPGAVYRPAFIVLASCCILPFGAYVLIASDWPFRSVGIGSFVYYAFGMVTSARFDVDSREAAEAETTKSLMAEVVSEKDLLQKIHEEKTRFLAATSHDLSQPLHAQGYYLHLLREKITDPSISEIIDCIENSWRGQVEMLEGLVEINRLDSGSVVPQILPCRIKPLLVGLEAEFKAMASAKAITLIVESDDVELKTDPLLFSRILRNLISNAVKFTPHGGEISVRVTYANGTAFVCVTDTGPGIAADKQDTIFDEYVQLEKSGTNVKSGVGLGLAIVRRLCNLLGLELELISAPDKGTSFKISTPASPYEPPNSVTERAVEEIHPFAQSPLIVLVDDQPTVLSAMGSLLSIWGCQVLSATKPDDAIDLLGEIVAQPALLIVDKRLGDGEDGVTLIEMLRDEVNEAVPAILMSGDLGGNEGLSLPDGVTYLKKPIEPTILKQTISNLIARHDLVS